MEYSGIKRWWMSKILTFPSIFYPFLTHLNINFIGGLNTCPDPPTILKNQDILSRFLSRFSYTLLLKNTRFLQNVVIFTLYGKIKNKIG